MLKRIIPLILALLLLLSAIAPAVMAAEAASGTCGDGITWSYANNVLTITGSGDMDDGAPWEAYKDKIETVIFTGGVTKVGASAFENYDRLETIDFGDSMREIGKRAFYDCNDIVEIRLPATFRVFGEECFRNCQMLERVICEGGMPSFKNSCLYTGNYISVFYPPNNPWPQEYVSQLISNFGGKLGIMMASEEIMAQGFPDTASDPEPTDTTTPAEETTAPTEAPAVAVNATEPSTVPTETATVPTQPATEPVTVPAQPPETTAAPTEAETQAPVETTEDSFLFTQETEPPVQEDAPKSSSWIGIVMIAAVLTFLLSGAMIFRSTRSRGGRYR